MCLNFSVSFDKKVARYLRPYSATSVVEVQRQLEQLVKDPKSSLCLYPGDFAVYRVGKFDDNEGVFLHMSKPEFIMEVSSCLPEGSGTPRTSQSNFVPPKAPSKLTKFDGFISAKAPSKFDGPKLNTSLVKGGKK